jgi:hypothetical protein
VKLLQSALLSATAHYSDADDHNFLNVPSLRRRRMTTDDQKLVDGAIALAIVGMVVAMVVWYWVA